MRKSRPNTDATQEACDRFYFMTGPCCSGCDHWHSLNSLIGECTRSAPVSNEEREGMLGIRNLSLSLAAGHVITNRDHVCGDFEDNFDWSTLPLAYLERVGFHLTNNTGGRDG